MNNEFLVIALVVILPAALLWAIFISRSGGGSGKARYNLGIPRAMRPGLPDEKLEGSRLERILWGGVAATFATAIFIPAYWLPESSRQESFTERFNEESLERGELIFKEAPDLPEESNPQEFKEVEHAIALGMGCARCHSNTDAPSNAAGGYVDPATGEIVRYQAPPLGNVFQRWDEEVIRFTIERGRPGTPMPTWGVQYGGPMTEQMVNDIIAYLKSLPGNQVGPEIRDSCNPTGDEKLSGGQKKLCGKEIFEVRCAVCHGPLGQGKEEDGLLPADFPDPDELDPNALEDGLTGTWYPGMALWRGDVKHLDKDLHFYTIVNGRRFAFMPPFGEAPSQGIPANPYPLTEAQIKAVIKYERSL